MDEWTRSIEIWREGPAPESHAWAPELTDVPSEVTPGTDVAIRGSLLTGVSEASGGRSPSPTDHPVAMWMPIEGAPAFGTLTVWSPDAATWTMPATGYPGPGLLFVATNGIMSAAAPVAASLAPNGTACTDGSVCSSGLCVDGVCCDLACDGPCEACSSAIKGSGPDGRCEPVADGTDPYGLCGERFTCVAGACGLALCTTNLDCPDGYYCAADGRCDTVVPDDAVGCSPACALGATHPRPMGRMGLVFLAFSWGVGLRRRQGTRS
jgi:hypothetical protein